MSARQQRVIGDLAGERGAALRGSSRDAAAILLPIDLSSVSSGAGDIREARDTSVEIRATIATAVVCDTSGSKFVLSPGGDGADTYAGTLQLDRGGGYGLGACRPPTRADELASASHPITATTPGIDAHMAGKCGPMAQRHHPMLNVVAQSASRVALTLDSQPPNGRSRRCRSASRVPYAIFSLYRGSDGQWYLGQRDWK